MSTNTDHVRPNSKDTLVSEQSGPSPLIHKEPENDSPVGERTYQASQKQQQQPGSSASSMTQHEPERDVEKGQNPSSEDDKKPKQERDPDLVEFDGPDDPANPQNFSKAKKWRITMILSLLTLTITFASSVFSSATEVIAKKYEIGLITATLGVSLFVAGFATGPLVWGPFSEAYGRMIPLTVGYVIFAIFQIPVAVAQNLETIMICRFLGGFFGCAPLSVVGGSMADIWNPVDRGVAIAIFAGATFIGPVAGPIVGGFVTQSYLGWRWTAWITLFMAAFALVLNLAFVPETYAPIILARKAKKLRFETKNWALHAKIEEQEISPKDVMVRYLFRPIQMLMLEPILLLITIYMALIYGILYLFFESYPVSFQQERKWNLGVGALPFLGITVGVILGAIVVSWITQTRFKRKFLEGGGKPIPEERLPPMVIGAFMLPIGLFWFAWTSNPHISWVPSVLAGIPTGMGVYMIFLQGLNYIIDCYLMNANSALAGNTFLRSFAGAGFPLFAIPMFKKLGVAWATSLLGFLTVAFIPVPILFFIYGKKLRSYSKFVPRL